MYGKVNQESLCVFGGGGEKNCYKDGKSAGEGKGGDLGGGRSIKKKKREEKGRAKWRERE